MHDEYQAFLLRFQRSDQQPHWRVRLENALDGEVKRFATEREALRYLLKKLDIDFHLQPCGCESNMY